MSLMFTLAQWTYAGPGHDHGPAIGAAGPSGPVTLSESQRRNLDLRMVETEIRSMGRTVDVTATLVVPPERHGIVSASFPGRIDKVLVKLGEVVPAGAPVLRVTPLAVGSSPQTLVAPVAGHVIRQPSVPGLAFTPETVLMEIGDDAELLAQGLFFQSPVLTHLKPGAKAFFTLDVYPERRFEGFLQRLDTGHGPEDPAFHIYALIPNPDHALRPNFRGRLTFEIEPPHAVVVVPRRAILGSLGDLFVFIENDDGLFERRDVVTGLRNGDWVEVVEGLLPGERIVTQGNYQLQFITPVGEVGGAADHGHAH
jgi:multidrug efflux pump subunit AcrA (membrane-fusion protein)